MLIIDAIDEYLTEKKPQLSHKTYVWYTARLVELEKWCSSHGITELGKITPSHVAQFIDGLKSENSYTRHGYGQVVKGFLRYFLDDNDAGISEKTVRRIKLTKQVIKGVEIFTPFEIDKLLRACERLPFPFRGRAIVLTLLDTGIRASEMCYDSSRPEEETGLRMDRLVLGRDQDSYIWVMGKGRKSRTVGLGNDTRMALKRYISRERKRDVSDYVFLSRKNEPLGVRMLETYLDELGNEAGVKNVHPHRFRHHFAVNQLMLGTSDLVLMSLMGHTSLDATKVYTRAMTQAQARKVAPSVVDKHMRRARA